MPDANESLTLDGLARILRDHAGDAASQFAQLREQDARLQIHLREQDAQFQAHLREQDAQFQAQQREQDARFQARLDELHREIGDVAGMVRDLSQVVARQMDAREEDRQHIRQIFARMEQHDAMIAQTTQEIRRILDAIERRGGNGGSRPDAAQ
jgi:chromosome segregation ATPase